MSDKLQSTRARWVRWTAVSSILILLSGCSDAERQSAEIRASFDSVRLRGDGQIRVMQLSDSLDEAVQQGARVDVIIDPTVSTEAVAQIVLPSDSTQPRSTDVSAVVDGISELAVDEALTWRIEAVSPTGALVPLADAARGAGVSPVNISPFGDIRIDPKTLEEKQ